VTVLYNGSPRTGEAAVNPTTAYASVSQKFVGAGVALTGVLVSMRNNGTPIGLSIQCDIYASDAGGLPTGAVLASATSVINDSDLTGAHADYTYTFSGFTPANGAAYCAVITFDDLGLGSTIFVGTIAAGADGGALFIFSTWGELGTNLYGTISDAAVGPTITAQPQDANNNVGDTATFSVTATSSGGALSYQWQEAIDQAFANIGGATSAGYTTPASVQSPSGVNRRYRCVVTDSNGSVTSSAATLFVSAGPLLAIQIGGAPISVELAFPAAPASGTSAINIGGAPASFEQTFTAPAAEGAWSFMLGMAAMTATGLAAITGTGAATLPAITASGAGNTVSRGSGAATLPALVADGDGVAVDTGAGAGTLPAFQAAGTGSPVIVGSAGATLPAMTAAGGDAVIAPPVAPPAQSGGIFRRRGREPEPLKAISGTGAATLSPISASGTGTPIIAGAGAAVLPSLAARGRGAPSAIGAGRATLPALRARGKGAGSVIADEYWLLLEAA
jgi:large repetitive protein